MDHIKFNKEFVAFLHFIAAGEANIGHLRKDGQTIIHRALYIKVNIVEDSGVRPPQCLTNDEEKKWRTLHATNYTS